MILLAFAPRRVCRAAVPLRKTTTTTIQHPTRSVGKYLISPLTKLLDGGWIACSVSIRSGSGRGTTDRVVRLTRLFRDRLGAAEYAMAEGLRWIGGGARAPAGLPA